jgi:hypothetical protein
LFTLALELKKTVSELLSSLDSQELTEWMAYYQIAPFGEFRRDLQAGVIASTSANIHRGENTKPYLPSDFLLFPDKPERDHDEMERELEAALNARCV